MVDSSDEVRITECNDELLTLLGEQKLDKVPLLIFANKQDLELSLSGDEVNKLYKFLDYRFNEIKKYNKQTLRIICMFCIKRGEC